MTDQSPQVHRIAVAALVRDGEVLLVHRHAGRKAYPSCWDLVGGHIEAGETPVDAVRRECREEIGVEIANPRPFPLTVNDPRLEVHGFVVTHWSGHPENLATDEHDDLRWFPPQALDALAMTRAVAVPDIVAVIPSP